MKKDYEFWANKKTIKNLELYTKLTGLFFFSLGLNFFLVFVYWKFIVQYEFAGLVLILSILMLMLTPIVMTDHSKENRDLVATVSYGIVHGGCTITSMLVTQFWLLGIIYVFEVLIAILLLLNHYHNKNSEKRYKKKR